MNEIFASALSELKQKDQLRKLSSFEGLPSKFIIRDQRRCLNLSSNNYLGLAQHPRLKEAATRATVELGTGAGGSRLLGGGNKLFDALELRLNEIRPLGKGLVFNSGFAANLGTLEVLSKIMGPIFSDKLNHASITEGLKLSGGQGTFQRYRHKDVTHLEELLKKYLDPKKPGIVCTETLFSMDGDFAPIGEILSLQKKYGFFLYLDEAHSTGCYPEFLNAAVESGRKENNLLVMGTFGKAYGGFGAYVSGSESCIDYLINHARSFIFSTALPPSVIATALEAIELVKEEPWRAGKLKAISDFSRKLMKEVDLDLGMSESHILPVIVGSNADAIKLSDFLFHGGFHAPPIRHPTVPIGKARLRINLTSEMEEGEMIQLTETLVAGLKTLK